MATLQERLQIKRVPIDKWSTREQLCLASAVVRSGDQNWMSVSRALKPFAEPNRPPDWFSQKNCAAQYGSLLENVETPKRKKRASGVESGVETPGESILKKLTHERKLELRRKLEEEKREYLKLKEEMELIKSGAASDSQVEKMCQEVEEEERQKEQDAIAHSLWLKQREERKLEVERVFRPVKITPGASGQKRRALDPAEISGSFVGSSEDGATSGGANMPGESSPKGLGPQGAEPAKPALSPLLTSLLKTPAHVPTVTSSILHSAITSQSSQSLQVGQGPQSGQSLSAGQRGTSPTIASLLSTSASVPVSPSLQQLVSTAISQEPAGNFPGRTEGPLVVPLESKAPEGVKQIKQEVPEISEVNLDPPELSAENIKVEPSESSANLETDAEVKLEVVDPEETVDPADSEVKTEPETEEAIQTQVDIYDFDNNSKTSSEETLKEPEIDAAGDVDPEPGEKSADLPEAGGADAGLGEAEENLPEESTDSKVGGNTIRESKPGGNPARDNKSGGGNTVREQKSSGNPSGQNKPGGNSSGINKPGKREGEGPEDFCEVSKGSVEIVEVLLMEDEDSDKEMNKKVSELKRDIIRDKKEKEAGFTPRERKESGFLPVVARERKEPGFLPLTLAPRDKKESGFGALMAREKKEWVGLTGREKKESGFGGSDGIFSPEDKPGQKETSVYDEYDFDDVKKEETPKGAEPELSIDLDADFSRKSTFTPEYSETFLDDVNIEVTKLDKSGKAKRDYSRMRKKEEKDIDILLAVEKAVSASLEENEILEETGSGSEKDSQDSDKKSDSSKKLKDNTERSNSPWTEEEEVLPKTRRRLSTTPATPSDSIPNSPASGTAVFDDDRDYRTWKKSVMLVYNRLAAHKCASLFLKPITDEQAPGYHSLIYRPMDLQTIRKNIENGHIRSTAEFQRDVLLMFNNAIMYNKSNETVFNMARQMQQEGLQQIQILLQAQTQVETPARRETRTSESGLKRKRGQEDLLKNKKRRDE